MLQDFFVLHFIVRHHTRAANATADGRTDGRSVRGHSPTIPNIPLVNTIFFHQDQAWGGGL